MHLLPSVAGCSQRNMGRRLTLPKAMQLENGSMQVNAVFITFKK